MSLAAHVRTLGRGPGRSRSLDFDEAADAMGLMLSDDAAPEAIGALLMLLRMKGETAEEIAGLSAGAQAAVTADLAPPALDWPSYAAGRTRGLPWFLLSARLVADAGHTVLIHGHNGQDTRVRAGLAAAEIPLVERWAEAESALKTHGIAYLPLERLAPRLFHLLALREVLGLRSCINTVARMLNPAGAAASVQGVFHPVYRGLQAAAAARLGWRALSVIKGGGGEFERNPAKPVEAFGLRASQAWEATLPARWDGRRRMLDAAGDLSALRWGAGAYEAAIVTGTAALALDTLGVAAPDRVAAGLWQARQRRHAA